MQLDLAARAALPLLALAALASTSPTASAATIAPHYQTEVTLVCPAGCTATFPKLPANQGLDIDHVACDVTTAGEVVDVGIILLPSSLNFNMPVGIIWQRKVGSINAYTLGGEVNVRVQPGRQFQVGILTLNGNGNTFGTCSVTGTRLVSN